MTQPSWICIANLGDDSSIEYGGAFILVDRRGNYDPECWIIRPYCPDAEPDRCANGWGKMHRFSIQRCHRIKADQIGDNPHHIFSPSWYGDSESLRSLASSTGIRLDDLIAQFCSYSAVTRASAMIAAGEHWGFDNLDSCPEELQIKEAKTICRRAMRDIKRSAQFPDGWI